MLVPALGEGSALNSDAEEYNGRHGVSPHPPCLDSCRPISSNNSLGQYNIGIVSTTTATQIQSPPCTWTLDLSLVSIF
jgi:hypothetical protein